MTVASDSDEHRYQTEGGFSTQGGESRRQARQAAETPGSARVPVTVFVEGEMTAKQARSGYRFWGTLCILAAVAALVASVQQRPLLIIAAATATACFWFPTYFYIGLREDIERGE